MTTLEVPKQTKSQKLRAVESDLNNLLIDSRFLSGLPAFEKFQTEAEAWCNRLKAVREGLDNEK